MQLHQPVRHLGREEARRDGVAQDVPRAQLDGQVLGQMDHGRLRGRVREGGVLAEAADADACGGGCDDDPGGLVLGRFGLEEGGESASSVYYIHREKRGCGHLLLHQIKHTLHVQIHHLGERRLGMRLELFAPGGARVGEEDVNVVRRLAHFGHEAVQLRHLGVVGGDGDGLRAGPFVGQRVQRRHGLVAGFGLA